MKNNIIVAAAVLLGVFLSFDFALASCPSLTSVDGTAVTFVGELTDTGGDSYTIAWFEYGKTKSYGQKTSEQTLTQTGLYCLSVSNLSSCTTYNYRAVAKNTAGTSYGENKTFTTTCDSASVNIRANGYDDSVTISYNNSANLTWTSYNADYCYASGDWSGTKSLSGSQSTGSLTSSKTYTITCTGSGGSVSDWVTVNVGSQVSTDFLINKTVRNLSKGTVFFSDLLLAISFAKPLERYISKSSNSSSISLHFFNGKTTTPSFSLRASFGKVMIFVEICVVIF